MKRQVCLTCAFLCLCGLLMSGCNKKTISSVSEKVQAASTAIQQQAGVPLPDSLAEMGDRWDDAHGVPWAVAGSLAQICNLSYSGQEEVDAAFARWGFGKVNQFQSASLYACMASNDQTVVIAFRGTDDLKDWLVNADVAPLPVPQGVIHRGFYEGMKTLYPQLVAAAGAHGVDKKHFWITGHSLGGALAVAFAYECAAQGRLKPSGVVTFGQPLLADSALGGYLSGALGGNYVRFVNERDVVTRVPPGYVHFGKLVWFHEGKLVTDAQPASSHPEFQPLSVAEFDSLRKSIRELRQSGKGFDAATLQSYGAQVAAITDHLMAGYLRGIAAFGR